MRRSFTTEDVLAGQPRAVARAISNVENQTAGYEAFEDELAAHVGTGWRVGITGPPGAGKSTLVNQLLTRLHETYERIGVVAVDPSSPFSGGALLGDRVRMDDRNDGTFVRSVATRGALGGLSRQTEAVADVMDAAGFDPVVVETVGVGQAELDVAQAADTVVVVLVPESGDVIQAMKAGLMEIADVFCVNKSDHPDADVLVHALHAALRLRAGAAWTPPVVKTTATQAGGADALAEAIERHKTFLTAGTGWAERRALRYRRKVRRLVEAAWTASFWTAERRHVLDQATSGDLNAALGPHALAARLVTLGS